ncbi:MAG: electron transport complex subunit RsxC [Pseudomonadota bacterium]
MAKRFRGGVHPDDSKLTRDKAISEIPLPETLILSISQHIGAPARPEVEVGQKVLKYQPVASPGGFVSMALHAPTSGTVKAIEPAPHPSGRFVTAVVIEPDGRDEALDLSENADPDLTRGPEKWKEMIRDSGIVGMGGAAFPTHVKLSPPEDKPIDLLLANGVECEPYLTADHRLMLESPEEILEGLSIAMKIVGARKAVVGIEANKPDAIEVMKNTVLPEGVTVEVLPVMYPQGAEKQLIQAVTKREVPTGGLPMDVGVVVQNVGTLAAIKQAVRNGRPMIDRVMTLGGSLPNGPGNYLVRIGTPLSHIVEQTGGLKGPASRFISGGPMMGQALTGLESPVTKGTSGLLAFGPGELRPLKQRACIRCGSCVSVCPASLMPHTLGNMVEFQVFDQLAQFNINDCIECGSCAYVCPADRNMVQFIKQGKAELLAAAGK